MESWDGLSWVNKGKYIYTYTPITVDVSERQEKFDYKLSNNFPNPFNPSTTIKYSIPRDEKRETKNIKLIVFDVLGREVTTLVNEKQQPGNYEIEFSAKGRFGTDGDGSGLTSGIYFYRLQAGDYIETKKMILLK